MQSLDGVIQPIPIANEGIDQLEDEQQRDQGRRQPPTPGRPKCFLGRRASGIRAQALTEVARDYRLWGMIQLVVL